MSYRTGWVKYLTFCQRTNISLWPITESKLQLFATALARRVSVNTIRVYLNGIQYYSLIIGCPVKIAGMSALKMVLKGIRREQGVKMRRTPRAPIGISHLHELNDIIKTYFNSRDYRMIMAAVLLAFYGLLRSSEYTSPGKYTYDDNTNLTRRDIKISDVGMKIRIKVSKTDPFREGATITIPWVESKLCPVVAMIRYLDFSPLLGPLFQFSNGVYLTRMHVGDILNRYIKQPMNLSTHSFRIGGATFLSECGVSEHIIQKLGRWSSECYKKYVRLTSNHVHEAFQLVRKNLNKRSRMSNMVTSVVTKDTGNVGI